MTSVNLNHSYQVMTTIVKLKIFLIKDWTFLFQGFKRQTKEKLMYEPSILNGFQGSIQRYLRSKGRNIDIFSGYLFNNPKKKHFPNVKGGGNYFVINTVK